VSLAAPVIVRGVGKNGRKDLEKQWAKTDRMTYTHTLNELK